MRETCLLHGGGPDLLGGSRPSGDGLGSVSEPSLVVSLIKTSGRLPGRLTGDCRKGARNRCRQTAFPRVQTDSH